MTVPPPEVLALVVADYIYRDDVSGRHSILGTRSLIRPNSFPWTHPALGIYAAFVDGRGEITFRFRLIDADEEGPILGEELVSITFPDPLREIEIAVYLTDLEFLQPGDYRVQLYANDELLRERRLIVLPFSIP